MTFLGSFSADYSDYKWNIVDLGLISYGKALQKQNETWEGVKEGGDHVIYLLEHEQVITLGRRTDESHLLRTREELEAKGIELFRVDRGGSATYHGPGQLVGYLHCRSSRVGGIHELVRRILEAVAETIRSFGIDCVVDNDNPGIWTNSEVPRKLAAVGLSNKDGYTKHGFAINVDLPLTGFAAIVPCGLTLPVTTMAIETGSHLDVSTVRDQVITELKVQLTKPLPQLNEI